YARMSTAKVKRSSPGVPDDPRWEAFDSAVIGARVKALREASALSLRDLAERSGVSAPMLSQVERGETSPTLTVAARIASGLDLRLSQLLRLDETGAVTIVRASEHGGGGNAKRGHRFEVMTAAQPGQRSELSRHTLEPGGATSSTWATASPSTPTCPTILRTPPTPRLPFWRSSRRVCDGVRRAMPKTMF